MTENNLGITLGQVSAWQQRTTTPMPCDYSPGPYM